MRSESSWCVSEVWKNKYVLKRTSECSVVCEESAFLECVNYELVALVDWLPSSPVRMKY